MVVLEEFEFFLDLRKKFIGKFLGQLKLLPIVAEQNQLILLLIFDKELDIELVGLLNVFILEGKRLFHQVQDAHYIGSFEAEDSLLHKELFLVGVHVDFEDRDVSERLL